MFTTAVRTSLPLILSTAVLIGCGDDTKDTDTGPACAAPVADAGADQEAALGSTVTLDGSASTVCEGKEPMFNWSFQAVPVDSAIADSALSDNKTTTAISPSFAPDVAGDYALALVVSDGESESAEDIVVVNVASGDLPPVADCGDSKYGHVGERTELDGSESYDPEGAQLWFSWALSSAPDCSDLGTADVGDSTESTAQIVPDCEGIFVVSLVVGDGEQWSDPDYCSVDVAGGNRAPVADAGDSGDLSPCTDNPLKLNGFGSYDLDGDELEYEWSVVDVPDDSAVTDDSFDDRTIPDPYLEWDVFGTYVFQLTVSDGEEWSSPDVVSYTIIDDTDNEAPVANAGDDTVSLPA